MVQSFESLVSLLLLLLLLLLLWLMLIRMWTRMMLQELLGY
jgi:hypothetical protein